MQNCISKILSYPLTYLNKIRQLTKSQIFLKDSIFFPSYSFLLITSILCNLMLSIWMIYYFFSADINQCYSGVTLGVRILSCIYPIYQIIIFLILIISISTSQTNIWKIIIFLFFSIISTSFGFGGLGVVYLCMVNKQDPSAIPNSFLTQNYFIQIIVYAMIVFIFMYILIVPFTSWLQNRRDPKVQRTSCECFLYVLHCIFQILLLIGAVLMFALIIGGIPIMFFLLNGLTHTYSYFQREFLGFLLTSIIAPPTMFIIVFLFHKYVGYPCTEEEMEVNQNSTNNTKQVQINKQTKQLSKINDKQNKQHQIVQHKPQDDDKIIQNNTQRQVLLENNQNKQFGDQQHQKVIKSKSKIKK